MASPDNTVVAPSFTADASGAVWSISSPSTKGAQLCRNGIIDTTTRNVVMMLYYGGTLYYENAAGNFYAYNGSGYTQTSDPRLAVPTSTATPTPHRRRSAPVIPIRF